MKIVKFQGGLANQMFQYALLKGLEQTFNEPVLADISMFNMYQTHRYELEYVFGVGLRYATYRDMKQVYRCSKDYNITRIQRKLFGPGKFEYEEIPHVEIDEHVFTENVNRYYVGSWITPQYAAKVEPILRDAFQFKLPLDNTNRELLKSIKESNSVSLHVRRGNYLLLPQYCGICEIDYYNKAITYILQKVPNAHFFIFSNDIPWCRDNIVPLVKDAKVTVVDGNSGWANYVDMQLMKECKHNIIANSTFSWWGAWLNDNPQKNVVAPKYWYRTSKFNYNCPEWHLIDISI